jgi:hypothetical protein
MQRLQLAATIGSALSCLVIGAGITACDEGDGDSVPIGVATEVPTTIVVTASDPDDLRRAVPDLVERDRAFAEALAQSPPVLQLDEGALDDRQRLAQSLALGDEELIKYTWSVPDHKPLRSEIVHVDPANDRQLAAAPDCQPASCYVVSLYNYAENMTSQATVDVDSGSVVKVDYQVETQPDLNAQLEDLAWKIALNTPEVMAELGIEDADDPLAGVERTTNGVACEQSRHLCAAPTLHVDDRVLWIITDLTDGRVIGMRWAGEENLSAAPPSEATLLGEYIDSTYCNESTPLSRNGWEMDYIMTRSDGLRLMDVTFDGKPVLRGTKLVDWHVSYDREEAFGYSDAVGCPFFSSAAVVAMQAPVFESIEQDGQEIGFAMVQDYVHPLWPGACMYNYRQRYEFYDDGRFRLAMASNGGGCGDDGTYRPVQRIVPADESVSFSEWQEGSWFEWDREGWQLQDTETELSPEGYQYLLTASDGSGYYVEPGRGQFGDGGLGDNAFVFVTTYRPDEGDEDMPTIGPCCNADYQQGPEKFMVPEPEGLGGKDIVVWYVPQLKNNATEGEEYCWARSRVEAGLYETDYWPCYAGPMFVPVGG